MDAVERQEGKGEAVKGRKAKHVRYGTCEDCGKQFARRAIDKNDDGRYCAKHYKERRGDAVHS